MTLSAFEVQLRKHLKCEVEIILNENRSTMLNLLEKSRHKARLSMHKMFLEAPEPIIEAIAHYMKGKRHDRSSLRAYIQTHLHRFDYPLDREKLIEQGETYHLRELYEPLNKRYFEGKLSCMFTWFGSARSKNKIRITLGQYQENTRLIKVHRLLDHPSCPLYFVSFILYHEMLHAVIPGSSDARGRFCIHGKAFKEREREFEHYKEALFWEKKNKERFFR